MIDLRQTPQYANYMLSLGWKVEKIDNNYIYLKKIPLLGWYAKLQRPNGKVNLRKIYDELQAKYKISNFIFEPLTTNPPTRHPLPTTLSYAKSISLPSKTIQIDLTKSQNQLLKEMKQKTRYNIKLAQKNGIIIEGSKDINSFIKLWHQTSLSRGGMLPARKEIEGIFKAFGNKCSLLLAYQDNNLLGGVLITYSPNTAYYLYAASNKEGKKLFAPTLLAWEAILEAKKRKLKIFDFDGIYDERFPRQTKAWKGFTKFKEGFGGQIIEFPKPMEKHNNSLVKTILG